ncbi:hypothetical protein MKZ38_001212 [Zalerion maritima]|uniref:Uncharacterized protein n=1 Tax=Zalerion maritima TaxID=339359 RepID=A0AAD5WXK3_9PEZI|nr:hypothetical protein MKZ38_001212 [Zalerion maritima]
MGIQTQDQVALLGYRSGKLGLGSYNKWALSSTIPPATSNFDNLDACDEFYVPPNQIGRLSCMDHMDVEYDRSVSHFLSGQPTTQNCSRPQNAVMAAGQLQESSSAPASSRLAD